MAACSCSSGNYACQTSSDCCQPASCINGICQTGGGCGMPGNYCGQGTPSCCAGYFCDPATLICSGGGTCNPVGAQCGYPGAPPCCPGKACVNGFCKPSQCTPAYNPCDATMPCCSGNCDPAQNFCTCSLAGAACPSRS